MFGSSYSKHYMLFCIDWGDRETSEYPEYDLVFDCVTGQIEYDEGYMDGDPKDFRFASVTGLTRGSHEEIQAVGLPDLFENDLEAIGKDLAMIAGPDMKSIFKQTLYYGEIILVFNWEGGMTESTYMGPSEGWSECYYIGPLDGLKIEA